MTTTKKTPAKDTPPTTTEVISQVPEQPSPARASTTPKGGPRISGKLAKPVYLIHRGKFSATIPAVTQERLITDPDDDKFGDVVEDTIVAEYDVSGELPKGSRFGNRKIRVAHEIWDAAEAASLRERGFEEATDAEITASEKQQSSSRRVDEIAAQDRVRAQEKLRRMTGGGVRRADRDEE